MKKSIKAEVISEAESEDEKDESKYVTIIFSNYRILIKAEKLKNFTKMCQTVTLSGNLKRLVLVTVLRS